MLPFTIVIWIRALLTRGVGATLPQLADAHLRPTFRRRPQDARRHCACARRDGLLESQCSRSTTSNDVATGTDCANAGASRCIPFLSDAGSAVWFFRVTMAQVHAL